MLGVVTSGRLPAGACASGPGAGAVAFGGRRGDGRVLVAAATFRFLTVFFFGFAAVPRAARPFGRARLVALREPVDFAFRRLVRSAIGADSSSEVARGIKDCVERRSVGRSGLPTCSQIAANLPAKGEYDPRRPPRCSPRRTVR